MITALSSSLCIMLYSQGIYINIREQAMQNQIRELNREITYLQEQQRSIRESQAMPMNLENIQRTMHELIDQKNKLIYEIKEPATGDAPKETEGKKQRPGDYPETEPEREY